LKIALPCPGFCRLPAICTCKYVIRSGKAAESDERKKSLPIFLMNNSSPHPTETPAAPLIQIDPFLSTPGRGEFGTEDLAWPSPPSSTANYQYADESRSSSRQSLHPKFTKPKFEPPRPKSLFRGFERPSLSRIVILAVLCFITYPAFYLLTLVAKDRSLFIVRAIVSVWCSGVGFALGYILLKTGAQYLEAAGELTPVVCRDSLRIPNSLGDRDPHESRR